VDALLCFSTERHVVANTSASPLHVADIDTCTYKISILTLSPIVSNLTYKHLIVKPLTKLL
jgi:hypothetical protein